MNPDFLFFKRYLYSQKLIISKLSFMKDFSYITNSSPAFIENLYRDFINNPESVDPELKKFFEGFDFAIGDAKIGTNGTSITPAPIPAKETPSEDGIDW